MTNPYYNNGGQPADASKGIAARTRKELVNVAAGFDKFPVVNSMLAGFTYSATTAGIANTYTAVISDKITSYLTGLRLSVVVNISNTGASTINVNSLGAKDIRDFSGAAIGSGDLLEDQLSEIVYNGTGGFFVLTSSLASIADAAAASALAASNSATSASGSVTTASGFADDAEASVATATSEADDAAASAILAASYAIFNKYDATGAPTANDDGANTSGNGTFVVGSEWVNVSTDLSYKCMDISTGAAVWTGTNEASEVIYPQNSKSADYTLVIGDAGKQIFHPATDTAARNFTIPANASVAFEIGAVVLIVNEPAAGSITITINSDTLSDLNGNTGKVVIPGGNLLTLLKVTATKWIVSFDNKKLPDYFIAVAHTSSPYVTAYPWSASGFGTKFTNPGTLPVGGGLGVAFSPLGTEIAVAHDTSPYVTAYPWSAAGFGTKFTNPGTLPVGIGRSVAFGPSGTEIAVAHTSSPYVTAYPWSASGFGTKFTNPGTLPAGIGRSVAFGF